MTFKIMLIEDDCALREQVSEMLVHQGYEVYEVTDFKTVIEQVEREKPSLVILDLNLPYMDGNYFCRLIRKNDTMPIIITSARNSDADQILGMELGSDDYIVKPYNIQLLLTRIAAALRRTYGEYSRVQPVQIGGVSLDEAGMKLKYEDKERELSKNEYRLAKLFLASPGQVITREVLLDAIWDGKDFVDDNTLTVNVTRLKKKLEELGLPEAIKTKRGVGYLFEILAK